MALYVGHIESAVFGDILHAHQVLQSIQLYNEDPDVHGLIVQLPLDSIHPMSTEKVTNAVDPDKDVDG